MTAPDKQVIADAADLLDRAADHIIRYGWVQGCWYIAGGKDTFTAPACASGAIDLAAGHDPYRVFGVGLRRPRADVKAQILLCEYLGVVGISYWNDKPERTKDEVVDALRGAARKARAS